LEALDRWDLVGRRSDRESELKNVWVSVFLFHVKTAIIKILVPFIIKSALKYPEEDQKQYDTQLE
jgi:hypothetical protein